MKLVAQRGAGELLIRTMENNMTDKGIQEHCTWALMQMTLRGMGQRGVGHPLNVMGSRRQWGVAIGESGSFRHIVWRLRRRSAGTSGTCRGCAPCHRCPEGLPGREARSTRRDMGPQELFGERYAGGGGRLLSRMPACAWRVHGQRWP